MGGGGVVPECNTPPLICPNIHHSLERGQREGAGREGQRGRGSNVTKC